MSSWGWCCACCWCLGNAIALRVQDEVFLNGTIILPHKEIKETILEPGTIIM